MSSTTPISAIDHNLGRIAFHMNRLGIARVEVEYLGGGDSGGIEEVHYVDAADNELKLPSENFSDMAKVLHRAWEGSAMRIEAQDHPVASLRDLLVITTFHALTTSGNDGWELDEGGRGTFTILANGAARLCHDSYVEGEELDTTHYNVADLSKPEAELTPEKKALLESIQKTARHLTQKGAAWAAVDYSGSGGVDEFRAEDANGNAIASPDAFGLDSLLDDVLEDISRSGFENNEGGRGTLTVRADGTATIEHFDVIEETESSEHTFGAWQDEDEAVETA